MTKRHATLALLPVFLIVLAGAQHQDRDIISDPFLEAQKELREVMETLTRDVMASNIKGLQDLHLNSKKFTKFGPRSFERQGVSSTNTTEARFFGSVKILNWETKGLKIDVFGDVGIVTYYPHVSFVKDGQRTSSSGRQTLVFVKTAKGWKIAHEHGTTKK